MQRKFGARERPAGRSAERSKLFYDINDLYRQIALRAIGSFNVSQMLGTSSTQSVFVIVFFVSFDESLVQASPRLATIFLVGATR